MSEDLLEYVATIPVIKAFSNEETRTGKVLQGMRDYIHWVKNSMTSIAVPMSIISMFLEGGVVVMIITGLVLIGSGDLSVASFILALILGGIFASCYRPFSISVLFTTSQPNGYVPLPAFRPKKMWI